MLKQIKLTRQTHKAIGRTAARCSAWMALAIVSLAAGNAEAGLFSINSSSTNIEIFTGSAGTNSMETSIDNGIHGPVTLSGFSGQIVKSSYLSGVSTNQSTDLIVPVSSPAGSFVKGTSTLNFTALDNLDYVSFGGWGFNVDGDGTLANREWKWSLFDNTSGTYLENYSRNTLNGVDSGDSNTGSQTGKLFTGRSYTYSSEFTLSGTPAFDEAISSGQISGFLTTVSAVPEPSSVALLGLAGLGMYIRRRRR